MRAGTKALVVLATFAIVMVALAIVSANDGRIARGYLASVLLVMIIYALFSLGLSLEFGYAGLVNFGHVAFMGLGAYTMAIVFERADPSLAVRLEGGSLGGVLSTALLALVAGALAALPLLASAPRVARGRIRTRHVAWTAALLGSLVAVVVFASTFPLGAGGAHNMVAFLAVAAAVLVAATAGVLLGLPALRLREDYLAIVSIGAAEIVQSVFTNEEGLTHGTLGIQRIQRPIVEWARGSDAWTGLSDSLDVSAVLLAHIFVALVAVVYVFVLLQALAASPWGRVLKAIREDEDVAASLGKNVRAYKLQALGIGSAIAALAGVLLVWNLSNVYPEHFLSLLTFYAFIIVIVGGVGDHVGALVGSIVLWGVFELARNLTILEGLGLRNVAGPPQAIFIGVLLIVIMMVRPQGIVGSKEELLFAK